MAIPVELERYKIYVAPDSKKTQGLRTGDIVRRQYFDGSSSIYSLMCVLSNGTDKRIATEALYDNSGNIALDEDGKIRTQEIEKDVPYFVGALLEGSAPQSGELLDFARITNLFDVNRSGALYLTASDNESPFMDVVDGIAKNKSLCWPEGVAISGFQDSKSQYITIGNDLSTTYIDAVNEQNRILHVSRNAANSGFVGLQQDFYESILTQKLVLISYKAKASKDIAVGAELSYANGNIKDAEWQEHFTSEWQYYFQAVTITNSGRHLRTFKLDFSNLEVSDWLEIADFNIILLDSISNFGDAISMRIGKLDGVADPVFGTLSGYGAYIQKLYASQTAHISGTLTAGDENGFASTFYAGKIHRNCFKNSCDINFLQAVQIDDQTLLNPTGMGHVYKIADEISLVMEAQSREWLNERIGQRYCFSFWAYSKKPCQLIISQNNISIGSAQIASSQTHEWRRISIFFDLCLPSLSEEAMMIGVLPTFFDSVYDVVENSINPDIQELYITAPQLEAGEYCTQYQPTDDVLDDTDDYGAWFARGGIGGTIQNPLLRLNYDGSGSIDTRTGSFRLNQDGSGYFAKENIRWDKNGNVTFGKNVTLNWDNFSPETQEEFNPKSVRIIGADTFFVAVQNDIDNSYISSPQKIVLTLHEDGFSSTSSQRQWYLLNEEAWVKIPGENGSTFTIFPNSALWYGEASNLPIADDCSSAAYSATACITLKCLVTLNDTQVCSDSFTVRKQYVDGHTIKITSSAGNVFQNGMCSTTLTATVYYQGQPVPLETILERYKFVWHRYSANDLANELDFNDIDISDTSDSITLNYAMNGADVFVCELRSNDSFDFTFPIVFGDEFSWNFPIISQQIDYGS